MPGISGEQDFWIVGSRFYFEPLGANGQRSGEMIDLGTIDAANPEIDAQIVELKDSESGVLRLVSQGLLRVDETYSITVKNFNFRNLQMFFGGKAVSENQAANIIPAPFTLDAEEISRTTTNGVTPTGGVLLVQLRTTEGIPIRNISTTAVASATSNTGNVLQIDVDFRNGTNYVVWDGPKGIIRIVKLDGGGANSFIGMTVSNGVITAYPATGFTVTFTGHVANTGYSGNRVIYPQTASASDLTGYAHIYWTRNNGADVSARTFRCQIQPAGSALSSEDYSSWNLLVTAIAEVDSAGSAEPVGRYTNIRWNNLATGGNQGLTGEEGNENVLPPPPPEE